MKEKAIADEIVGICVVCNRKVNKNNKVTRKIDGLLVCCSGCVDKFIKEKKKWTSENWEAICRLQVLYEERKKIETKA